MNNLTYQKALEPLCDLNKKIILTVSSVPIQVTFTQNDCVVANEFSKSVLRVRVELLSQKFKNVDYFPSYEIVKTVGLEAYINDNVHVRDDIVKKITEYMINIYSTENRE